MGEVMPFIEEILNGVNSIICDLQPQQIHTFYEAVGIMISSQQDAVTQERLIEQYMALPNESFDRYIQGTSKYSILFITIFFSCYKGCCLSPRVRDRQGNC